MVMSSVVGSANSTFASSDDATIVPSSNRAFIATSVIGSGSVVVQPKKANREGVVCRSEVSQSDCGLPIKFISPHEDGHVAGIVLNFECLLINILHLMAGDCQQLFFQVLNSNDLLQTKITKLYCYTNRPCMLLTAIIL